MRHLIYLHIPKTAGKSVRSLIEDSGFCVRRFMQKEPSRKKLLATRSTLSLPANFPVALVGHRCVAEMEQWLDGDVLKVTTIRDPLDMYVSLYNYWYSCGIRGDGVRGELIKVDGEEVEFDRWVKEKLSGNIYCRFFIITNTAS